MLSMAPCPGGCNYNYSCPYVNCKHVLPSEVSLALHIERFHDEEYDQLRPLVRIRPASAGSTNRPQKPPPLPGKKVPSFHFLTQAVARPSPGGQSLLCSDLMCPQALALTLRAAFLLVTLGSFSQLLSAQTASIHRSSATLQKRNCRLCVPPQIRQRLHALRYRKLRQNPLRMRLPPRHDAYKELEG